MPIKRGSSSHPKDKYYHLLQKEIQDRRKEDALRSACFTIDSYDRELRKAKGELRKAYECIGHLQQVSQRLYERLTNRVDQRSSATKKR